MDKIQVKKEELISILKENRNIHQKDYNDAINGYRISVEKELKKKLKIVKSAEKFDLYFNELNEPSCHVKDYDNVIGMLEISIDKDIFITMQDYLKYYKNEWGWHQDWKFSNAGFIGIGTTVPKTIKK